MLIFDNLQTLFWLDNKLEKNYLKFDIYHTAKYNKTFYKKYRFLVNDVSLVAHWL